MNRIKFRIWDGKSYAYTGTTHDGIGLDQGGHPFLRFYINWGKTGYNLLSKDYTLEQFTGLKDKNTRDIYEGDILENVESTKEIIASGHWEEDDFERSVVTWDDELGRFVLHFHSKYGGEGYTGREEHFDLYVKDGSTVIGNINENSELLK